jgi:uncharacterized protein (DUF427 family)
VDNSASQASGRPVLEPGPDHPISITPTPTKVTVSVGDQVVAVSDHALTLSESNYPPAQYLPLTDVNPDLITSTSTATYCPYKGDCSYYTVAAPGGDLVDAAWTYRQPYPAVAEITEYVAFYPNKFTITVA